MRFAQLAKAVSTGLLQQIPVVGPVLQTILEEQSQAAFEARLIEVLRRLADDQQAATIDRPTLIPALLLAEAELERKLQPKAAPQRRFLYLAAKRYASAVRTYEIAVQYSFLWRSYHKNTLAAISHVDKIRVGDVIALGYREPNKFHLLLPLVVTDRGPHAEAIDQIRFPSRSYTPFVWADDVLTPVLEAEDYRADPLFNRQTGLSVQPLFAHLASDEAKVALQGAYPSPGINAIWSDSSPRLPKAVQDWIKGL